MFLSQGEATLETGLRPNSSEGKGKETLERGFAPLLSTFPLPLIREGGQGDRLINLLKDGRFVNGLLPLGAYRDDIDRARNKLFQPGYILLGLSRQLLIVPHVAGRRLPAG